MERRLKNQYRLQLAVSLVNCILFSAVFPIIKKWLVLSCDFYLNVEQVMPALMTIIVGVSTKYSDKMKEAMCNFFIVIYGILVLLNVVGAIFVVAYYRAIGITILIVIQFITTGLLIPSLSITSKIFKARMFEKADDREEADLGMTVVQSISMLVGCGISFIIKDLVDTSVVPETLDTTMKIIVITFGISNAISYLNWAIAYIGFPNIKGSEKKRTN
jgi:hypothetical protein